MDSALQPVRAQLEALMLEPMLEPLAGAFGEYGTIATQVFSQALERAMEQQHA